MPDAVWRHAPATAPSTRKVGTDCGIFVWKMRGRCASGSRPVRRACTSSVASQVGSRRDGRGRVRVGEEPAGDVEQLVAVRVEVALAADALEHGRERR